MKVGFIGLGQMGSGMAWSLLSAGHSLTVYNRTSSKTDELVKAGAVAASRISDACDGDLVITMLANDAAVESVVYGSGGLLASLPKDRIHVSSSTISVALSDRLAADHLNAGQRFVAAPVFGRPEVAAAGTLSVIAAGDKGTILDVAPVLDAIGKRTVIISDTPKVANLVKLSGNFLIASVIESLGEAVALVAREGVDLDNYVDMLTSTLFNAPVYKTYAKLIVEGTFEPARFSAPLGYKDIRLVLAAADDLRVPMPVASLLRDRFLTLLAHGGEKLDWSAIGQLASRDSGAP
ncbi:NAD(P)-dependent oxidoreductase [Bradyrhizobium tropiciagri]|uniref:NAD(P)-dependent oxidoreductase n=1 Tax=Bradyrhizobium tropiciagri TaxID=312253 RepID=UPI00067B62D0|nr:NAD(P)-dependent oxidoreductase [Bradyrhizobium tropiciagri]